MALFRLSFLIKRLVRDSFIMTGDELLRERSSSSLSKSNFLLVVLVTDRNIGGVYWRVREQGKDVGYVVVRGDEAVAIISKSE